MQVSRREQVRSLLLPQRSGSADRRSSRSAELSSTERVRAAAAATKILTRPRWLLFHLVVVALAVTFVVLGHWQLSVSDAKHFDFFNFQYALQWWLFAAFTGFLWIRIVQFRFRPPAPVRSAQGIVLASGETAARQGPALLASPPAKAGDQPVLYRGYVMAQSSRQPVRSHGDTLHDAYNNYLWQIAVANGDTPDIDALTESPTPGLTGDETHPEFGGRQLP